MDENRYSEWLKLFADECEYWIPSNEEDIDPNKHVSIMYCDRKMLNNHVERLLQGKAFAQSPQSRLRRIIGGINMRYAITYDKVYTFNDNYYGRGIINNARILIKDELNRCLIDEHVHSWFTTNLDGVENLQIVTIDDIANIYEFSKGYDRKYLESGDELFEIEPSRKYGIINSDILKIGNIQSKEASISVYNLHLQVTIRLVNDDDTSQTRLITVSLGNLNTTGI